MNTQKCGAQDEQENGNNNDVSLRFHLTVYMETRVSINSLRPLFDCEFQSAASELPFHKSAAVESPTGIGFHERACLLCHNLKSPVVPDSILAKKL